MVLTIDGFVCDICDPEPPKKTLTHPRNDARNFVLCPTCGKKAILASKALDCWFAMCNNGHNWVPLGGWKVGDKTDNNGSLVMVYSVDGKNVKWVFA